MRGLLGDAGDLDGEEFDAIGWVGEGPGASFGVVDAELFPEAIGLALANHRCARGIYFIQRPCQRAKFLREVLACGPSQRGRRGVGGRCGPREEGEEQVDGGVLFCRQFPQ